MVVFVAWVNDVMVLGLPSLVEHVQRDLEESFTCKGQGELTEYVGSKLTFSCADDGKGTAKPQGWIRLLDFELTVHDHPVAVEAAGGGESGWR